MTKTRTIHIRGMFCEHCETRIRKALLSLPGVEEAEASFEKEMYRGRGIRDGSGG